MHPKTEERLKRIKELDGYIDVLERRKKDVIIECKHYDYKVEYHSSFAHDNTPVRKCVVCDKKAFGGPSEEEKTELFIKEMKSMGFWEPGEYVKFTSIVGIIDDLKNGWNIEDLICLDEKNTK